MAEGSGREQVRADLYRRLRQIEGVDIEDVIDCPEHLDHSAFLIRYGDHVARIPFDIDWHNAGLIKP